MALCSPKPLRSLPGSAPIVNQPPKIQDQDSPSLSRHLRFSYPDAVYGDARPAYEALHEEIRLPGSATLRDTRVTEKAIVVKAMVMLKEDLDQTMAMLSLGVYRILNLARRVGCGGNRGFMNPSGWKCPRRIGFLFPHECDRATPDGCPECDNGQVTDPFAQRTDRYGLRRLRQLSRCRNGRTGAQSRTISPKPTAKIWCGARKRYEDDMTAS